MRHLSLKKCFFCFCSLVLVRFFTFLLLRYDSLPDYSYNPVKGCSIPRLEDPFLPEVMELLRKPCNLTNECGKKIPLLFESPISLDSLIVPVISKEAFRRLGISSCCYREVSSAPFNNYRLSGSCHSLSLSTVNKLPPDIEFAAVYCTLFTKSLQLNYSYFENKTLNTPILVDIHYFVPLKPKVEERLRSKSLPPSEDRLNVLIIGTDAVSRNQMIRAMPLTYKFLTEDLQAVDMKGYNKVGFNTFPCLTPLFFNMHYEEVLSTCVNKAAGYFDECPLIWNQFAANGFRTSFHEDWPSAGIFNYFIPGFRSSQPVDYYNRGPILLHSAKAKNELCNGPSLTSLLLLDYTKKFVLRMDAENKSYFHLVWRTLPTHERFECATVQDVPLRNLLKWLRVGGHLNKTALIVLSDHGFSFALTSRGVGASSSEARIPPMFFVLPETFKRKYPKAYQNLQANSDYRLTTLFDLHQTLLDILDPWELQADKLITREVELDEQEVNETLPRGISHFLPIPKSRSCEDADIPASYCVCEGTWKNVSLGHKIFSVPEGARFAVDEINRLLIDSHFNSCSKLRISKILNAKVHTIQGRKSGMKRESSSKASSFLIEMETEPGAAHFQVQVSKDPDKGWGIIKEIARLDRYSIKGHGRCVKVRSMEKFCVCK